MGIIVAVITMIYFFYAVFIAGRNDFFSWDNDWLGLIVSGGFVALFGVANDLEESWDKELKEMSLEKSERYNENCLYLKHESDFYAYWAFKVCSYLIAIVGVIAIAIILWSIFGAISIAPTTVIIILLLLLLLK